ncbi:MAG: hypothetical protein AAF203_05400 [Pseudomonadota bacterium]
MKLLIGLLTLAVSFGAMADDNRSEATLSCVTDQGNLVVLNLKYGEISEMTKEGKVTLDADDGYDNTVAIRAGWPSKEVIRVFHHEDPKKTTLLVLRNAGSRGKLTGTYQNISGEKMDVHCL